MTTLQDTLESNWDDIKESIKTKWNKLTDEDLEKINGSYQELSEKLQKLYGYKMKEIQTGIQEFLESSDFDKIKTKTKNKLDEIKTIVFSTLDEYFKSAKQKSINTEKVVTDYAKKNPFKLIGLAATCGLLIGYLCKTHKS